MRRARRNAHRRLHPPRPAADGRAGARCSGCLAARLYQVQVVEGERYATLAEENRISARLIAPPRGRMLDRFGTVVAGNRLNWRALLIAEQTSDVERDARQLLPHRRRWPTTSAPASSARCAATAASSRSWCASS